MQAAIEARWRKADQEVFIVAIILNPFHKTRPFKPIQQTTLGAIYAMLDRLWRQFFSNSQGNAEAPPPELWTELNDYLHNRGRFQELDANVRALKLRADAAVSGYITISMHSAYWEYFRGLL